MKNLQKRTLFKAAALSALALATLAGCSKEAAAPAAKPAAKPEAAVAGPLKIGFMYVSPVGDGGWTFQHEKARQALQAEFGDKIQTSLVESVAEGPDAERVLRHLVDQGDKLVFATSFGYMEPVQKVAANNKDVKFEHATGYKTADNVRTYDARTYEGAYLAGIIAGGMTKTNQIGVVASVPIPEVMRNINSYVLGAQSVNPKIKARVVWVSDWFNPPKESEAANKLINGGVDVLFQNTNSPAVLKTAQERGVRAFGKDSDMSAYAPKAHLASAEINWLPYYRKATQDVLNGSWSTDQYWWGVKEGAMDLVSIADDVPQELKDKVAAAKAGLKAGTFHIWKGPLKDNTGKVQLAETAVGDHGFLTGINFYVEGIESKVPSAEK